MFGLEGFQVLSVLRMESHLGGQEEVSPGTIKEKKKMAGELQLEW